MFGNHLVVALSIFIITYLLIVTEKFNRTSVAMFGAFLMLVFNIEAQEKAIEYIDLNTIGLLIGMMIIVNIMKRSGIFEYMAIRAAKMSKGDPWKIVVAFSIITAVSSALLDNVTTILLIVPVTLVITDSLEISPIPFLVPEILIANIGGTATLIGDPPNIMIGSATKLGFMDFAVNLAPVVVVIFIVTMLVLKYLNRNEYCCKEEHFNRIERMDEKLAIQDMNLLVKSCIILALTILGFTFHQMLGYESATVALVGASTLLLFSKLDPEEIFLEIEWTTIFFFAALFILVGALEEVGVIETLADKLLHITKGNVFMTTMIILWGSAIASSFLDNIPFVATMIPLIKSMGATGAMDVGPLWWALALGACLGGNGTLVGASANVIVSGMLEKKGKKLSFVEYMKVGFPLMLLSVAISSVYLMVFYL